MKSRMRADSPAPKSCAVCSRDVCYSHLVNIEHHSGSVERMDVVAQKRLPEIVGWSSADALANADDESPKIASD
jgi:hypothetical protein